MYKNLKQLMDEAQALDYTVGAFNAHNLEICLLYTSDAADD